MEILVDTYEYHHGEYRLTITHYTNSKKEYYYNAIIDRNGTLISRLNTHKFTDMWRYFDSVETRITDFYKTHSDGHETK